MLSLAAGCGTTRMTDTQRTATEQLLISKAIDEAIGQFDFRCLAGKSIYLDAQYLDACVDKGYVVSSLRQQLLAGGCILQEDRAKATYVVEARSGALGTDRHSLLIGVPQMTVPTFLPGQPSQIPEIPVAKKTDEQGVAKLALFAYNRQTGQRLWQSGMVAASSSARDLWVLGLGPLRKGTIVQGTEFAGEELPLPGPDEARTGSRRGMHPENLVVAARSWPEPAPSRPTPTRLWESLFPAWLSSPTKATPTKATPSKPAPGTAVVSGKPAPEPKPAALPPYAVNTGGQAETEPSKIVNSAMGVKPDG
jgi:hypothetical protein